MWNTLKLGTSADTFLKWTRWLSDIAVYPSIFMHGDSCLSVSFAVRPSLTSDYLVRISSNVLFYIIQLVFRNNF